MKSSEVLVGVVETMTVDEQYDQMCTNAGITREEFNDLIAAEVGDLFAAMAAEDGDDPGADGVSGSDIADIITERTAAAPR